MLEVPTNPTPLVRTVAPPATVVSLVSTLPLAPLSAPHALLVAFVLPAHLLLPRAMPVLTPPQVRDRVPLVLLVPTSPTQVRALVTSAPSDTSPVVPVLLHAQLVTQALTLPPLGQRRAAFALPASTLIPRVLLHASLALLARVPSRSPPSVTTARQAHMLPPVRPTLV